MAKQIPLLMIVAGMLLGCQQKAMIDPLPPPSFSGPVVLQAAPPAVQPPRPKPPEAKPPAAAAPAASIPAEWRPAAKPNNWQWIIIHHSDTPVGSAALFDRAHRAKGWDELGYHFVIGNGTETRDGQVEVGSRWRTQKWGAHTKTADNRFNNYGIGICLVGNFEVDRPTPAQMRSLAKLTAYLMTTYKIPANRVLGHRDCKPTDCPGRNLNVAEVRRLAAQYAREAGMEVFADRGAPGGELLHDR